MACPVTLFAPAGLCLKRADSDHKCGQAVLSRDYPGMEAKPDLLRIG
jgi:hypothetical protein